MKVLVKGREQQGWAKEFTCTVRGGCGAKLLVEEGDVICWSRSDYSGDTDHYCGFRCGHCGIENYRSVNEFDGIDYGKAYKRKDYPRVQTVADVG